MANNIDVTQLFCQNSVLSTLRKTAQECETSRIAQPPIAVQSDGGYAGASILAVDRAGSVLCFRNAKHEGECRYSAYGYGPLHPVFPIVGFNGELVDQGAERYGLGMGYREYDTRLMRFLSPDHVSPFGAGGLNTYSYCAGDPINYNDSSGHSREWLSYLYYRKKLEGKRGQVKLSVQQFKLEKYHYDRRVAKLNSKGSSLDNLEERRAYRRLEKAKAGVYQSQQQEDLYRLKKAKARYPEHSEEAIQQKLSKKPAVPKFDPDRYTGAPPWLLAYPSALGRRARDIRGALTARLRALVTDMSGP